MSIRIRPSSQHGFSLLEMSVVLAIMGTIALAAWQLLPRLAHTGAPGSAADLTLNAAERALLGFARIEGRLPCPDTTGDGRENCSPSATSGRLPTRTLGISLPAPLIYGVSGPLTTAPTESGFNRFQMLLPEPGPIHLNGLDLCVNLRDHQRNGTGMSVGGARVAAVLAHPGDVDADGNGSFFDADYAAGVFPAPGAARRHDYDDITRTLALGQLAVQLGCMERLAQANGAARSAYAAWDLWRFHQQYVDFRSLAYDVRETNKTFAEVAVVLASLDLALAITTGITSFSLDLYANVAAPGAFAAPGAVAKAAITAAIVAAGAAYVSALVNVASAHLALEKAGTQLAAANLRLAEAQLAYLDAQQRAADEDERGLNR